MTIATGSHTAPAEALRDAAWHTVEEADRPPVGERPAYDLRTSVRLAAVPARASLIGTAHGVYEVFVNGLRVGDEELSPGFASYRRRLAVQRWQVADLLAPGVNTISVTLSDGWFRGRHGFQRRADGFGTDLGLLLALLDENDTTLMATDDRWEWRPSHITRADLMDGQTSDLRLLDDDRPWHPVRLSDDPLCDDRSRLIDPIAPPVRRTQWLRPVAVTSPRPGVSVVDFGQNINGWVRLGGLGPRGTVTVLRHGEALAADGSLTTEHLRAFDFTTRELLDAGQVDRVVAAGIEAETFEPRHTTHGFRYVQIERDGAPVQPSDVAAAVVHTDLTPVGDFACSDPRLEALHEAVRWSLRDNACAVPTDCPQRERSGFTGDWQIFVGTAALLYDVADFSRDWLADLAADQWADGRVPTVVPNPAGDRPSGDAFEDMSAGSAGWGDAAAIVPWQLWRAYGDEAALAEAYPAARAWVDYGSRAAAGARHPDRSAARPTEAAHERYLWDTGFHFGEWLQPDSPPRPDPTVDHGIVATAYLAHSAELVARAAVVLGRDADATHYGELAARVREAWRAEYLTAECRLTDETQAHYVRALAFGLVPADARPAVADRLAELVRDNGTRLSTGFLATGMLLPTLADHGHADLAYELLLSDRYPSWLGMLAHGATTMWEWWDGVTDDGVRGSLNHYGKGAVASFLYTHVAGIRLPEDPGPGEAGYARVLIAPVPGGGITHARASVQTRQGRLSSSWRLSDAGFELNIEIPTGTRADVVLPDGSIHAAEGGRHRFRSPSNTESKEQP